MFGHPRPLRSLQVEVTTRCSLSCTFCPRHSAASPVDRDLSDAAWARLVNDLPLADDVHLQGWGEPLLDARLRERVRDAHRAGCSVGLTSNGLALRYAADWIAAERVERIAISVAATPKLHEKQRGGPPLKHLWASIGALARARRHSRPRILVSAMLTRDGVDALTAIVGEAARAGADEVYVTHVDCTPTRELLDMAAFSGDTLREGLLQGIAAAAAAARRCRIGFRRPAVKAEDVLVCALDPRRIAFVAADGRIGPCVNMFLPGLDPLVRYDAAGKHIVTPIVWGRLPEDSLADALGRRADFLRPFEARIQAERTFAASLGGWGPDALRALDEADGARTRALAAAPLPPACRGCHKAVGW